MPITVTTPLPGQPSGPGYQAAAVTDVVGPFPVGSYWDYDILPQTGEIHVAHARHYTESSQSGATIGIITPSAPTNVVFEAASSALAPGADARLRIRHVQAPSTLLEQTTVQIKWEPNAGAPYLLSTQMYAIPASGGGGFTAADRALLSAIDLATHLVGPGGQLLNLSQLIANLPAAMHGRVLITPDRTGDGTLTRPSGPVPVDAQGIYWEIVSAPAGIGVDEGAPDVYEIRMLELRFVLTLGDGTEYTDEHRGFAEGRTSWWWGLRSPTRLEYSITPGVTVRFWWLVFLAGATLPVSVPLELFLPRGLRS